MLSLKKIKKEIAPFFKSAQGSHDWDHVERVYRLCRRLGKQEGADMKVLSLAAYLHDIGRAQEYKSKGKVLHAEKGAELGRKILQKYKVSEEKIKNIVHCIRSHSARAGVRPKTKEAKVLFDADKLDALGAIGIGRDFLFAGEIGSKLHNSRGVDVKKAAAYTKEDTAYREFVVKLSKLKNKMFTPAGKKIAKERHKFMKDFFNRFKKELDGLM